MATELGCVKVLDQEVRKKLRSGFNISSAVQAVEELVLNAVDAEATCIAVRVDLKHYFKIQVVDNGTGIAESNLEVIGTRYATSKCRSKEDLEKNLTHYGFRGEALASLATMSGILEITSKCKDSTRTYCKIFSHGKPLQLAASQSDRPSCGTTVTVHDFMYNFPVRRQNIQDELEVEGIRMRLEAIALMYPTISFTLRNDVNGNKIMQTRTGESVLDSFSHLFGREVAASMRHMKHELGPFKVDGYISKEPYHNKRLQFFFINKRLVLKTKIHKLVNEMLKDSGIMKHKGGEKSPHGSPSKMSRKAGIFVLNVSCGRHLYDITFEPQKTLVEIIDLEVLFTCVKECIRKFLVKENLDLAYDTQESTSQSSHSLKDSLPAKKSKFQLRQMKKWENRKKNKKCERKIFGQNVKFDDFPIARITLPVQRPKTLGTEVLQQFKSVEESTSEKTNSFEIQERLESVQKCRKWLQGCSFTKGSLPSSSNSIRNGDSHSVSVDKNSFHERKETIVDDILDQSSEGALRKNMEREDVEMNDVTALERVTLEKASDTDVAARATAVHQTTPVNATVMESSENNMKSKDIEMIPASEGSPNLNNSVYISTAQQTTPVKERGMERCMQSQNNTTGTNVTMLPPPPENLINSVCKSTAQQANPVNATGMKICLQSENNTKITNVKMFPASENLFNPVCKNPAQQTTPINVGGIDGCIQSESNASQSVKKIVMVCGFGKGDDQDLLQNLGLYTRQRSVDEEWEKRTRNLQSPVSSQLSPMKDGFFERDDHYKNLHGDVTQERRNTFLSNTAALDRHNDTFYTDPDAIEDTRNYAGVGNFSFIGSEAHCGRQSFEKLNITSDTSSCNIDKWEFSQNDVRHSLAVNKPCLFDKRVIEEKRQVSGIPTRFESRYKTKDDASLQPSNIFNDFQGLSNNRQSSAAKKKRSTDSQKDDSFGNFFRERYDHSSRPLDTFQTFDNVTAASKESQLKKNHNLKRESNELFIGNNSLRFSPEISKQEDDDAVRHNFRCMKSNPSNGENLSFATSRCRDPYRNWNKIQARTSQDSSDSFSLLPKQLNDEEPDEINFVNNCEFSDTEESKVTCLSENRRNESNIFGRKSRVRRKGLKECSNEFSFVPTDDEDFFNNARLNDSEEFMDFTQISIKGFGEEPVDELNNAFFPSQDNQFSGRAIAQKQVINNDISLAGSGTEATRLSSQGGNEVVVSKIANKARSFLQQFNYTSAKQEQMQKIPKNETQGAVATSKHKAIKDLKKRKYSEVSAFADIFRHPENNSIANTDPSPPKRPRSHESFLAEGQSLSSDRSSCMGQDYFLSGFRRRRSSAADVDSFGYGNISDNNALLASGNSPIKRNSMQSFESSSGTEDAFLKGFHPLRRHAVADADSQPPRSTNYCHFSLTSENDSMERNIREGCKNSTSTYDSSLMGSKAFRLLAIADDSSSRIDNSHNLSLASNKMSLESNTGKRSSPTDKDNFLMGYKISRPSIIAYVESPPLEISRSYNLGWKSRKSSMEGNTIPRFDVSSPTTENNISMGCKPCSGTDNADADFPSKSAVSYSFDWRSIKSPMNLNSRQLEVLSPIKKDSFLMDYKPSRRITHADSPLGSAENISSFSFSFGKSPARSSIKKWAEIDHTNKENSLNAYKPPRPGAILPETGELDKTISWKTLGTFGTPPADIKRALARLPSHSYKRSLMLRFLSSSPSDAEKSQREPSTLLRSSSYKWASHERPVNTTLQQRRTIWSTSTAIPSCANERPILPTIAGTRNSPNFMDRRSVSFSVNTNTYIEKQWQFDSLKSPDRNYSFIGNERLVEVPISNGRLERIVEMFTPLWNGNRLFSSNKLVKVDHRQGEPDYQSVFDNNYNRWNLSTQPWSCVGNMQNRRNSGNIVFLNNAMEAKAFEKPLRTSFLSDGHTNKIDELGYCKLGEKEETVSSCGNISKDEHSVFRSSVVDCPIVDEKSSPCVHSSDCCREESRLGSSFTPSKCAMQVPSVKLNLGVYEAPLNGIYSTDLLQKSSDESICGDRANVDKASSSNEPKMNKQPAKANSSEPQSKTTPIGGTENPIVLPSNKAGINEQPVKTKSLEPENETTPIGVAENITVLQNYTRSISKKLKLRLDSFRNGGSDRECHLQTFSTRGKSGRSEDLSNLSELMPSIYELDSGTKKSKEDNEKSSLYHPKEEATVVSNVSADKTCTSSAILPPTYDKNTSNEVSIVSRSLHLSADKTCTSSAILPPTDDKNTSNEVSIVSRSLHLSADKTCASSAILPLTDNKNISNEVSIVSRSLHLSTSEQFSSLAKIESSYKTQELPFTLSELTDEQQDSQSKCHITSGENLPNDSRTEVQQGDQNKDGIASTVSLPKSSCENQNLSAESLYNTVPSAVGENVNSGYRSQMNKNVYREDAATGIENRTLDDVTDDRNSYELRQIDAPGEESITKTSSPGPEFDAWALERSFLLPANVSPFKPRRKKERDMSCANITTEVADMVSEWENTTLNDFVDPQEKSSKTLFRQTHKFSRDIFDDIKVVGQWDRKLIVCTAGSLLLVVDQHAAHERVRLEQLQAEYQGEGSLKRCVMRPPLEVRVRPEVARCMSSRMTAFQRLGLSYFVRPDGYVQVTAVPHMLIQKASCEPKVHQEDQLVSFVESLLIEQADIVLGCGGAAAASRGPHIVHSMLASLACRGAIKFNDALTISECEELIAQLSGCKLPFQCAHGRPAILPVLDFLQLDSISTIPQVSQKPRLQKLKPKR